MKIIIDIPEWKYKSICEGVEASKRCGVVGVDPDIHEAIYNGTSLDDVKAEIKNDWQLKEFPSSPFSCGLKRTLDILDNIGKAESEE